MSAATASTIDNQLIAALPRRDRERLLEQCTLTELEFGADLCQADKPYRHAYFPLVGFISLVAKVADHPALEMNLIGNEGMLGATLVLDIRNAPLRAVVQGAGSAWRIRPAILQQQLRQSAKLRQLLHRYLYVQAAELAQVAACTRFHETEARLSRWLLLTHDRAHADHFHLTHQFLADMLGVQRGAVTLAAGELQRRGLIRYSRGDIHVLSRSGLEATSCECYAAVVGDYARQFH